MSKRHKKNALKKKRFKVLLSALVTVLLIGLLFYNADITQLWNILQKVNYFFIVLSILAYFGLNLCLAFRLYILLTHLGYNIEYSKILSFHFGSMVLADITPGKVGYFGMILLLKDRVKIEDSTSALTIGQILDFFLKIMGAFLFILIISEALVGEYRNVILLGVIFVLFLTIILSVLIWTPFALKFIDKFEKIPIGKKIKKLLVKVQNSSSELKPAITKSFAVSIIGWMFIGAQWYFIALAIGIEDFSIIYFLLLQPISSTVAFIPVTLGGIGLQESAIVALMKVSGTEYTSAFAMGVLIRGLSIMIDAICGINKVKEISLFTLTKIHK